MQRFFVGTLLIASSTLASTANAQDSNASGWSFRLAPYLWGTAIEGDVSHAGLPGDVHAGMSFRDLLDDLDAGTMGAFEARKGRHGLLVDGLFAEVSTRADLPVASAQLPVKLKASSATGLIAYQYRLADDGATQWDLIAGARFWSVRTELSYSLPAPPPPPTPQQYDGKQREHWNDLQVGLKGRHRFANGAVVGAWALVGSGGSDLSSDLMLMAGYEISQRTSVNVGYRWVSTNFKTASGFKFDTALQGPGLGMEFRF